jgi:hypothetical protein
MTQDQWNETRMGAAVDSFDSLGFGPFGLEEVCALAQKGRTKEARAAMKCG